ncbi:Hypothetical protein POVR2_LOCUS68 [uncultured virus]|nr:Hypothetical protein POVR2_LOCUS68 [uncultured virus]
MDAPSLPWTNIPSDVLYELSARLPNKTLKVLSQSEHWPSIGLASKQQDWWKERLEFLVGKPLQARSGNWAGVYRDIEKYGVRFDVDMNYYNDLIVPVLLELGADPSAYWIALSVASCNNVSGLKLLLSDSRTDLTSGIVAVAAQEGSIDCLALLLEDGRVDPAALENLAIRRAVENYRPEVLRLLLADKRTNPGELENEAIKMAAGRGYADIYQMLLQDKRVYTVEQNLENDYHLIEAVRGGHVAVVKILIDYLGDLYASEYYLREACSGYNLDMIKLLLALVTEYSLQDGGRLVELAQRTNRLQVAELLLSVPWIRDDYEDLQASRLG